MGIIVSLVVSIHFVFKLWYLIFLSSTALHLSSFLLLHHTTPRKHNSTVINLISCFSKEDTAVVKLLSTGPLTKAVILCQFPCLKNIENEVTQKIVDSLMWFEYKGFCGCYSLSFGATCRKRL